MSPELVDSLGYPFSGSLARHTPPTTLGQVVGGERIGHQGSAPLSWEQPPLPKQVPFLRVSGSCQPVSTARRLHGGWGVRKQRQEKMKRRVSAFSLNMSTTPHPELERLS